MSTASPRVLITNTVVLNTGDMAILCALLQHLEELGISPSNVVIHDKHPAAAAERYPHLQFAACLSSAIERRGPLERWLRRIKAAKAEALTRRWRFWMGARALKAGRTGLANRLLSASERSSLRDYAEADVVVSTGGTYLVENYSIQNRVLTYDVARLFGKDLVFYTQSMGPFDNPGNRKAMCRVLGNAALVLLRDERSRRHVEAIGARPSTLRVVADSVLALRSRVRTREIADAGLQRVAISVRSWKHFRQRDPRAGMQEYEEAIREGVRVLVEDYNAEVLFISTCQGVPAYAIDDAVVARRIVDRLPQNIRGRVHVDGDFHTPEQFVDAVRECNLVISTRMHGAILALIAGVPVIPIAYEFKTKELYAQMDMADWVEDIEAITAPSLVAKIHRFMSAPREIQEVFAAAVAERRADANRAKEFMHAVFNAHGASSTVRREEPLPVPETT